MLNSQSEANLAGVYPPLACKLRALANQLHDDSLGKVNLLVTCGVRSWTEQSIDYAIGRDITGSIVGKIITNAKPGQSWHLYGLAVDIAIETAAGKLDWEDRDQYWLDFLTKAAAMGLVEGALWHSKDGPHLQMTGIFPVTPTSEVQQLYRDGGTLAVWAAAFPDNGDQAISA